MISQKLFNFLTKKDLSKKDLEFVRTNIPSLLMKASENRLELFFLDMLRSKLPIEFEEKGLQEVLNKGLSLESKRKDTIIDITNAFSRKLLFVKSIYPFPALTSDLDVLLENESDYDEFLNVSKKQSFSYTEDEEYKGSLYKTDRLKVEPHKRISWYGQVFVDNTFLFKDSVLSNTEGLNLQTPGPASTLVVAVAHIFFDCQYVSLRELMLLGGIVDNPVLVEGAREQSVLYGWSNEFDYTLDIITTTLGRLNQGEFNKDLPIWLSLPRVVSKFVCMPLSASYLSNIFLVIASYYWKRLKMKTSKNVYRNSWLY